MKIVVVDDCIEMLDYYGKCIEKEFSQQYQQFELKKFSDISDIDMEFDILFTDVKMPDLDGITFAKECKGKKQNVIIVFFSDYDSYVWDSFSVEVAYFLRKKYFELELPKVVERCIELYRNQHQLLVLESGKQIIQYAMQDIFYVEAYRKHSVIYGKEDSVEVRIGFSEIERKLPQSEFIKIHRSYLVNYRYVRKVSPGVIELLNGVELPISKYRLHEVREQYLEYLK